MALKHSAERKQIFVCSECDARCSQAHTLREHFRDKHRMDISSAVASKMVATQTEEDHIAEKNPLNRPKRVHQIIKCKCGRTNKGEWVFKRHVKNIHGSDDFNSFIKSGKMDKAKAKKHARSYSTENLSQENVSGNPGDLTKPFYLASYLAFYE